MLLSVSDALFILEQYKYLLIFPVTIIEGPIITVISGFLVKMGILNFYVAYVLLVTGDLIGDMLHYVVGRYWRNSIWIKKYTRFVGYTENTEIFLENHFKKHATTTILLAKFSHGMGIAIHITAGIAKVNVWRYFLINLLSTIPKTFILILMGYYIGGSYLKINNYLNIIAAISFFILLFVSVAIISNRYVRNYIAKSD